MNLENRFNIFFNAEYIKEVEEEKETFTADKIPETGGVQEIHCDRGHQRGRPSDSSDCRRET